MAKATGAGGGYSKTRKMQGGYDKIKRLTPIPRPGSSMSVPGRKAGKLKKVR